MTPLLGVGYGLGMPSADAFNTNSDLRRQAVEAVRQAAKTTPDVALVLGSGLGPLADEIDDGVRVPYDTVPGMQSSSAPGHAGESEKSLAPVSPTEWQYL